MAVGAFTFTDPGFLAILENDIDFETDTMVAVLVDNAHTPNSGTDALYSAISTNECSDSDYTASFAEGLVLTTKAITDTGAGTFKFDADDMDFGNSVTISARYVYIVRRAGGTLVAGDLIMGYMDLNDGGSTNVSSTNGDFDVAWNASNGLATITVS